MKGRKDDPHLDKKRGGLDRTWQKGPPPGQEEGGSGQNLYIPDTRRSAHKKMALLRYSRAMEGQTLRSCMEKSYRIRWAGGGCRNVPIASRDGIRVLPLPSQAFILMHTVDGGHVFVRKFEMEKLGIFILALPT